MANITFLSWNIMNFGSKRISQSQKYERVKEGNKMRLVLKGQAKIYGLIAATCHNAGADLVGLMEYPKGATGRDAQTEIMTALGANWESLFFEAGNEAYCFFWNNTKLSILKRPAATGPAPAATGPAYDATDPLVAGLTDRKYDGKALEFPTENGKVGGRPAAFGFFTEATSGNIFCASVFHAPGPGTYTPLAGNRLAQAYVFRRQPQPQHYDNKTDAVVAKVVVGGDFNVNWGDGTRYIPDPNFTKRFMAYDSFTTATVNVCPGMTASITNELTSLTTVASFNAVTMTTSADVRASSFDHIFSKGLGGNAGTVHDVVALVQQGQPLAAAVAQYADTKAIAELPWQSRGDILNNLRDAFQFYRTLVSDHLPVYVVCAV